MNNKPGVPFDLPELPVEIDYGELVEQIIHTKGHPLSKGGPLFTLGDFLVIGGCVLGLGRWRKLLGGL
jgi:hypothetical protein